MVGVSRTVWVLHLKCCQVHSRGAVPQCCMPSRLHAMDFSRKPLSRQATSHVRVCKVGSKPYLRTAVYSVQGSRDPSLACTVPPAAAAVPMSEAGQWLTTLLALVQVLPPIATAQDGEK